MHLRQRAFALIEMLTVILMVSIGMMCMVGGIVAIQKAQIQTSRLMNRYAILTDFNSVIRKDVRSAVRMTLDEHGSGGEQVLVLDKERGEVVYTLLGERVRRVAVRGDDVGDKEWVFTRSEVICRLETPPGDGASALHVTTLWSSLSKDYPHPARRFHMTLRCMKELRDGNE